MRRKFKVVCMWSARAVRLAFPCLPQPKKPFLSLAPAELCCRCATVPRAVKRNASTRANPKDSALSVCLEHACLHCARVWCVFSVLAGETPHLGRRSVFRETRQRGSPCHSHGCRSLGRVRATFGQLRRHSSSQKYCSTPFVLEAKGRPIYISHMSNLFVPTELCIV